MKVYLDLLFLLNFGFDFLLLLSVSYVLKRGASIKRLLLGGLVGASSIFLLFFPMSSFFFLFKVLISLLMVFSTFGYQDFSYTKKNVLFLYSNSIVLGGMLYFLNFHFSYAQKGLVFFHRGISSSYWLLLVLGPIFLFLYGKQLKQLKNQYSHYYEVEVLKDSSFYHYKGYLDTGNHLKDPYTGKCILLVFDQSFLNQEKHPLLVPYETIEGRSLLSCIKCEKVRIQGVGECKNCLLGLLKKKPNIDGINCILSEQILEGTYDSIS